ncbi:MAG TPA: hypothetical protein VL154_11880, partial [Acetobacteraceae bacterium]|nr:hypothetical protein [Acetobacteraceae bacterium]
GWQHGNDHRGGWRGDRGWRGDHRDNSGAIIGGALLGLGLGAVIGGALAPPPAYYAPPPPVYYAPPPPAYYAPPPTVYYGYGG